MLKQRHTMLKQRHKHGPTVTGGKPLPPAAPPLESIPLERRSTELRVLIREDSKGVITMDWATTLQGSEVIIQMRPSHIIGQMRVATALLERDFYKAVTG
jgi:hypothetical protein